MKQLLVVLLLLCAWNTQAQVATYTGKVIGDDQVAVPFCVVMAVGRNEGDYCDENGSFSLLVTDTPKMLRFYCIGYEQKDVPLSEFNQSGRVVVLKKEAIGLGPVTIVANQGRLIHGVLGGKKLKHTSDCYQKYGDEDAMFFKADPARHGVLNEIFIYITDEGAPNTRFRVHVYDIDTVTHLPSRELTGSNLIVRGTKGNEWVTADVTAQRIPVGRGVFISVEWVSGYGNSTRGLQSKKHDEVRDHNGQVLGLTLNYGVPYMYHRNIFAGTWGFNYSANFCPMIYCTYSYYD